jgi:ribosomal-protein-alanine N-acetyltransferase
MSSTSIAISNLTLRWILQRDLKSLLTIEQEPPAPQWTEEDFRSVLQSADTAGCIAEVGTRAVGFLIYRVALEPEDCGIGSLSRLKWRFRGGPNGDGRPALRVTLLNMAISPGWRRYGIGRALLERIGQKLQQPQDCIQATVPESNLGVQLLLREGGYHAVGIRRGYFGSEDGYLMQRRRS